MLLGGSVVSLFRVKTTQCVLQVAGVGGFVAANLSHLCEALYFLAWMVSELERSRGHHVDSLSSIPGATLFAIGTWLKRLQGVTFADKPAVR